MVRMPMQLVSLTIYVGQNCGIFLSDLISSIIRRSTEGLDAYAISLTINLRQLDVCNEAILELYCPISFLLKYNGPVIVRKPRQFLPLSICVGQMFVMK